MSHDQTTNQRYAGPVPSDWDPTYDEQDEQPAAHGTRVRVRRSVAER